MDMIQRVSCLGCSQRAFLRVVTTGSSRVPLPDRSAELLDIGSILHELSRTINVYASAAFHKFSFMKSFLYLENISS